MHASHERTQEVAALLDVVVKDLLALLEPFTNLLERDMIGGKW
jgi:hypothetical protein